MSMHSVADAKNKLSELIDRAIGGEAIVITRHGRAVAELKPATQEGRSMTADDVAKLRASRVTPRGGDSAVNVVEQMRNEDAERLLRR